MTEIALTQVDAVLKKALAKNQDGLILENPDKSFLIASAKRYMVGHLKKVIVTRESFKDVPDNCHNQNAKCFVSIYRKGKLIACMSNRKTKDLLESVIDATSRCLEKDQRYLKIKDEIVSLEDIEFELCLLHNPLYVNGGSLKALKHQIELGVHSITIQLHNKQATFKASVAIAKNLTLKDTLEKLCIKAGLPKTSFRKKDCKITLWKTLQFREYNGQFKGTPKIIDIYRAHRIKFQSSITIDEIHQGIDLAKNYIIRHTDKTGNVTYEYDPITDHRNMSDSAAGLTRKIATAWVLAEVGQNYHHQLCLDTAKLIAKRIIDSYYEYNEMKKIGYLNYKDNVYLGPTAFLLLTLIAINDTSFYHILKNNLIHFILKSEGQGKLRTELSGDHYENPSSKELYYPGQGLLAIARAAHIYSNKDLLSIHMRVLPYYENLFITHKDRNNMVAWQSKAYAEAFFQTHQEKYAAFVIHMNESLIKQQRLLACDHPNMIGAFSNAGNLCGAAVFTEALLEAFRVAKRLEDNKRTELFRYHTLLGLRYIQQMQYQIEDLTMCANPKLTLGGYKSSLKLSQVRIDAIQHSLCALMNAHRYGIFL